VEFARRVGRRLVLAAKCNEEAELRYFEDEVRPRLGRGADFIGDVDATQKRELLGRAAALIFPIQWEEPFGLVMVEAMACGTPVLATNRGSVPEVVEDGVTGFVRNDVDGLVEAFAGVEELAPERIRERAASRFDAARMIGGYEAVYRTCSETSRPTIEPEVVVSPR